MDGIQQVRVAIAAGCFAVGLVVLGAIGLRPQWRRAVGRLLERGDSRRWLTGCLVLAFVLRAGPALLAPVEPVPGYDTRAYHHLATNIASGHGYSEHGEPTVYRPVGFPLFLAAAYALDGPRLAGLMQAAASTAALWLVVLLARAWDLGAGAERAAMLLVALSPEQIAYGQLLFSEPLATALTAGALVVGLTVIAQPRRTGLAALVGGLLGMAMLVRPTSLLVAVALAGAAIISRRIGARHLAAAGVCALVVAATWTPWVARNAIVFGRPIVLPTSGAVNFYIGNNPDATGRAGGNRYVYELLRTTAPADVPAAALRASWEFVRAHPGRTAVLFASKVAFLWADGRYGVRQVYVHRPWLGAWPYRALVLVSQVFRAVALGGGLIGAWLLMRRGREAGWFAIILVVLWTLLHCVTAATGRYAAHAMVLLMPVAAWWLAGATAPATQGAGGEPGSGAESALGMEPQA